MFDTPGSGGPCLERDERPTNQRERDLLVRLWDQVPDFAIRVAEACRKLDYRWDGELPTPVQIGSHLMLLAKGVESQIRNLPEQTEYVMSSRGLTIRVVRLGLGGRGYPLGAYLEFTPLSLSICDAPIGYQSGDPMQAR